MLVSREKLFIVVSCLGLFEQQQYKTHCINHSLYSTNKISKNRIHR